MDAILKHLVDILIEIDWYNKQRQRPCWMIKIQEAFDEQEQTTKDS